MKLEVRNGNVDNEVRSEKDKSNISPLSEATPRSHIQHLTSNLGFTIIELLITISLFVVLGLFITQTLASIFSNVEKTDNAARVRQEAEYSIAVIERHLREARSPVCAASSVTYEDPVGYSTSFSCTGSDPVRIASGAADLTSGNVTASSCSFTCISNPTQISISFTLSQYPASSDPRQTATTTVSTQVTPRNQ